MLSSDLAVILREQSPLDAFDEDMQGGHVNFLDALGGVGGHDDFVGADGQEQVAGFAIGFDAAGEDFVPAMHTR